MMTVHGGVHKNKELGDLFEITIMKAYKKPLTRNVKKGTCIANQDGEILNSKSEWHQPQIIRTKTTLVQGGGQTISWGLGLTSIGAAHLPGQGEVG